MSLIRLNIKGISFSQTQTGAYALILEEESGTKKLPIIIGSFEAQSIALALEKDIKSPRPITHDLMATIAKSFHINVKSVIIYKLEDGVFYSNIICEDIHGLEKEIDSRTSDAIALALRFDAPIYTSNEVMEKAGIFLDIDKIENLSNPEDTDQEDTDEDWEELEADLMHDMHNLTALDISDLNKLLEEAIQNEDYEKAAKVRDELNKRT